MKIAYMRLLCVAFVLLPFASLSCKSKAKEAPPMPTIHWRNADLVVNGKKVQLEVGNLEKPWPLVPIAPEQARRDTPQNTWVSWESVLAQGQTDKDLDRYADHYADPVIFRQRLKSPAAQFFDDARKTEDSPAVVALIRLGKGVRGAATVVVYSTRKQSNYSGKAMIQRGDKWYINEQIQLDDPVLRELSATAYKIVKE